MIINKRILFLLPLLLLCFYGKATHIVGGEMNYTCLGNDQYEITLTIFRDCFNGNPNAWFDDPASIGVFDENNVLLEEILLPLMNNDTLEPVLTSECLVVPPNVCVHTTTYIAIVELPAIAGGYQLAYQRCCRNQTIVNIIDPLDTGATYGVTISEAALNECNSNPKFQEWPPIYICVNEPIVFDQSAIDQDGDSIVYSLCTPLSGANPDIPQPQPPNNPPYLPVNWVDPPYSVDNMLNGSPGGIPLQINSQTGLLTGLPNTIGQFVVGICVEEYRNGQLISTTRRDFQYNVGLCGEASAAFAAPEVQCGSLSVLFENQSSGTTNFEWYFNDPNDPGATSMAIDPIYTFSDTGLYTVMMIAAPGAVCEDTAYQEVYLQNNTIDADFELDQGPCGDSVRITATDQSIDELYALESWEWTLQPGGATSNLPNPEFIITESDTFELTLTVTSEIGCTQAISENFIINLIEEELIGDTVVVCLGDSIHLNPVFDSTYTYLWEPSPDIADLQSPDPVVAPIVTTTYQVVVLDEASGCQDSLSVTVFVPDLVTAEAPLDTTICSEEIWLVGQSNFAEQFIWSNSPGFDFILGDQDSLLAAPQGPTTYYLLARDVYGCAAVDSVTVEGNAVDIQSTTQQAVCPGDFGAVAVVNLDNNDTLSVQWSPEDLIIAGATNTTAFVFLTEPGTYPFYVTVTNQHGCIKNDSTSITLIDTTDQISFLSQVQCSGYDVLFSSSSVNAPFYVWSFGDPDDPGATEIGPEVTHSYSAPGTYEVVVTLQNFITCPDTLIQEVVVGEPSITPDFNWEITSCSDSIVLSFTDQSMNDQSIIESWNWVFVDVDSSTQQHPELVITEDQLLEVQLTITSSDGCMDSVSQIIPIELPQLSLPDTVVACLGDTVGLNPDAVAGFNYQWSPGNLLLDPFAVNPQVALDSSQLFSLVATTLDGECILEREVFVQVPPDFEYLIAPDTAVCENEVLLYVESESTLNVSWHQIYNNDTLFVSTGQEALVFLPGDAQYLATLTDEYGCIKQDSVSVTLEQIQAFLANSESLCLGDSTELTVIDLAGGSNLEYSWSPSAEVITGQNTERILVSPATNQSFTVTITNAFGCTEIQSSLVQIADEVPPLEINAEADTLFSPGQVLLEATFDPAYEYLWQPSAGLNNITIYNPTAFIDSTTTYRVRIVDENGCSNEAEITLTVFSDCLPPYIYVPNAFTPNQDNLNDILTVRGNTIDEMYFAIYNRWGQLVFETRDPGEGWDGTFEGEDLSPDVYAYYLEVRCFNGATFANKGNISLIR
jgi:gliding motility-associated-like protein